jgi:uncharacterized protein (DUF1697 family)
VVVLLRGINVGGKHKLPMADLRQLCTDVGCVDVSTYIQSGNVVARSTLSPTTLEKRLEDAIAAAAGFDVAVMVRTATDLDLVLDSGIYANENDGTKRVVAFLKTPPPADALAAVDQDQFAPERCTLRGRELFFHLPNGQGRAKLPDAALRAVAPITSTIRNWKSITTLYAMAEQLERGAR